MLSILLALSFTDDYYFCEYLDRDGYSHRFFVPKEGDSPIVIDPDRSKLYMYTDSSVNCTTAQYVKVMHVTSQPRHVRKIFEWQKSGRFCSNLKTLKLTLSEC